MRDSKPPATVDDEVSAASISTAAERLHAYLVSHNWNGRALLGPDPGIRFNYRIGRFLKSALPRVNWHDQLYYLQAQGYWVLGNWRLFAHSQDDRYRQIALCCATEMLVRQRPDGAWEYPNPEWKGRVATAEGTWAALGLLETYRHSGDEIFLQGAERWYRYLVETIGFQRSENELAVNYFARLGRGRVPNNSAFTLRFFAELAAATGDNSPLEYCAGLMTFMEHVQLATGELPYVAPGDGKPGRVHFQCYQYNAFQCLDLMRYLEVGAHKVRCPLLSKLVDFLRGGLAPGGYAYYQCGQTYRTVNYHTAVLAAAFYEAERHGISAASLPHDCAYRRLLATQRRDGSFGYSRGDYRVLSDRRCYPRYLAMMLYHLLTRMAGDAQANDLVCPQESLSTNQ